MVFILKLKTHTDLDRFFSPTAERGDDLWDTSRRRSLLKHVAIVVFLPQEDTKLCMSKLLTPDTHKTTKTTWNFQKLKRLTFSLFWSSLTRWQWCLSVATNSTKSKKKRQSVFIKCQSFLVPGNTVHLAHFCLTCNWLRNTGLFSFFWQKQLFLNNGRMNFCKFMTKSLVIQQLEPPGDLVWS